MVSHVSTKHRSEIFDPSAGTLLDEDPKTELNKDTQLKTGLPAQAGGSQKGWPLSHVAALPCDTSLPTVIPVEIRNPGEAT